jgi:hypothetical protein
LPPGKPPGLLYEIEISREQVLWKRLYYYKLLTVYYCRGARRELGPMRTCLLGMYACWRRWGRADRDACNERGDSSFIDSNSWGSTSHSPSLASLMYNILCPATCPCDMFSTRALATHSFLPSTLLVIAESIVYYVKPISVRWLTETKIGFL